MRHLVVSFASGLLFAIGLGIAGMTQPEKIIGFLDFGGDWDPSMMFVMGGATLVYALAFPRIMRQPFSIFQVKFSLPSRTDIDKRLVLGAALFGAGWGIGGLCPGPAIVSVATGSGGVVLFIAAMIIGMYIFELVEGNVKLPTFRVPVQETTSP